MSDETHSDSSGLPPKINVRKAVPAKPAPAPESAPAPEAAAAPATPKPRPAAPKTPAGKPMARPKTIKARPIAKPVSAPAPSAEADAAPAEEKAAPATPAAPVKPVAKKPLAAAAKPRTVKAKPVVKSAAAPAEAPAKADDADPSVRVAAKRETTKIPLDAARPKEEEGEKTAKTVKAAKPIAKPKTVVAPKSKTPEISPEEATKQATAAASKRTTSRISLEAVLGAEDDDSSAGPKTIRLKRPGATASGKVNTVTTVRKKPVPKTAAAAKVDSTESADESGDTADATATQRKTVVVKKAGGARTGRKKVSVSRAGDEGASAAAAAGAPAGGAPKKKEGLGEPGWVFGVYSLVAVLVTCVLIYVITAQIVGPNASLTEYSYSKTGPELPWPGKLAGPRSY